MIASLKCQYAELLSDIGFIKADLTARKIGRLAPRTGDGVLAATGEEVPYWGGVGSIFVKAIFEFSFSSVLKLVPVHNFSYGNEFYFYVQCLANST